MGIFGWGKPAEQAKQTSDYAGLIQKPPRPRLVLFIHGIGGTPDKGTWAQFPELIAQNPDPKLNYDVALFGYNTSLMNIKKTPSVSEVAEFLHTKIETDYSAYGEIVIIAHSQGGLIARRYIADRLAANTHLAEKTSLKVKRVIFFATPHSGALSASIITTGVDIVKTVTGWPIPGASRQAKDLAIGSEELQKLYIDEKNENATRYCRTKFVVAHEDPLVDKTSAWGSHGPGDYFLVPEHDHFSIVKPDNADHPAFKIAREFLKEETPGPANLTGTDFDPPLLRDYIQEEHEDAETRERQRFIYRARVLPFIGREREEKTISNFLGATSRQFSWMLTHGSGGVGKSRLALEIVLAQQFGYWHAGFLPEGEIEERDWARWQPLQPTFMVVDYVSRQVKEVAGLLNELADRDKIRSLPYPVRILLLERDPDGQWLEIIKRKFTDLDISKSRAENLSLTALEDTWPIFETVWADLDPDIRATFPDRDGTLARLKNLDDQSRPLFAYLMADAMKRTCIDGGEVDERQWDKAALLKNVLTHEQNIWRAKARSLSLDVECEKEQRLLALATICGGLPVAALDEEPLSEPPLKKDMLEWREAKHKELFGTMCGAGVKKNIHPLEPDILGEFFALEWFKKEPDTARQLINYAWNNHPWGTVQFADRCRQDFIEHEALKILHDIVPKNAAGRFVWSLLTANLINAYGETRRLDEAAALYGDLKSLSESEYATSEISLQHAKSAFNLITDYGDVGRVEDAVKLYIDLKKLAEADDATVEIKLRQAMGAVNLITDYGKAGELEAAKGLYNDLKNLAEAKDATPELVLEQAKGALNLIIHYGKAGKLEAAKGLYDDLKKLSGAADTTPDIKLQHAKGAGALSMVYMKAGALTEARQWLETSNDLTTKLDDGELHTENAELEEALGEFDQAAKEEEREPKITSDGDDVKRPTDIPAEPVTPLAPTARHRSSIAVRPLQGFVLFIFASVILALIFTGAVLADEAQMRGLIDSLGGAKVLHSLVGLVLAGLQALP